MIELIFAFALFANNDIPSDGSKYCEPNCDTSPIEREEYIQRCLHALDEQINIDELNIDYDHKIYFCEQGYMQYREDSEKRDSINISAT